MSDDRHRGAVDRLLGAVPVNALVQQIDVQAMLERIDLNALLDQVDVNRLLSRVDVEDLLTRIDFGEVLAQSTKGIAGRALDALRLSAAHLDIAIDHWTDRVLRRNHADAGSSSPAGGTP
jgi:hypothetical protein